MEDKKTYGVSTGGKEKEDEKNKEFRILVGETPTRSRT